MLISQLRNEPFRERGRFLFDATSGNAHFLTEIRGIATMTKGEPLVTERLRAPAASQVMYRGDRSAKKLLESGLNQK